MSPIRKLYEGRMVGFGFGLVDFGYQQTRLFLHFFSARKGLLTAVTHPNFSLSSQWAMGVFAICLGIPLQF